MRQNLFVIIPAVLGVASAVYAQEALKGEVATVDEASGKIGIKLSGTVGSGDKTAPTNFKVQDGLDFIAEKPRRQSFNSRRKDRRRHDIKTTHQRISVAQLSVSQKRPGVSGSNHWR